MNRKILTFILTSICLLFLARPSIAIVTEYRKAVDAYKKEDYKTSYNLILPLATKGFAQAQYNLGVMYGNGRGVAKDYSKAIKWWNLAADQGNDKAQYSLGLMYEKGKGVKKNLKTAKKWFQLASNQGLAKAKEKLNLLLNKTKEHLQENTTSYKELKSSKELKKSYKEIKDLQTTNASLRSELDQIKSEKTKAIEATDQANAEAKQEQLASLKELKKSYKEIKDLQTTNASLRSELDQIKSEKTRAIEATDQANAKAKQEQLASSKESKKSYKKIKDLQTTNASLRSELDQIKSEKTEAIEATEQANAEAKQEQLASISDKPSELNTGSVSFREDAFNVARYGGGTITEAGDYINDSDRLHAAINSLDKKEFALARQLFLNLADKGMAEAQINLGIMFERGQGVPQNFKEAIRWYRLAADQGLIKAQGKLNSLLKKSAKAQINFGLGMRFESGEGVPQDFEEATRRYRLAADLGLIKAQEKLNLLLNKKEKILREKSASSQKFKSLKELKKNYKEIIDLQTTNASLRSELNQIKSEKTKAIKATSQANAKAKQEQHASTSGNPSELNTGSDSFRGDDFDVARSSADAMTKAGDYINDEFDSFGSECSQLKNKDQQSECFEPFFAAKSKDKIKKHSIFKKNSTPNLTKKSQPGKSRNNNKVITSKDLVSKHLDKWARAWEKQDIELYLSFYSKEFKGSKGRHADWRVSRQTALKRHANISIQLQNIQIHQSKDTVDINFIQTFKSDGFSDIGVKELVWAKNGSGWRIIKETWIPHKKTT